MLRVHFTNPSRTAEASQPTGTAYPSETLNVHASVPTRIPVRDTTGVEYVFHLHGQFFEIQSRIDGTAWPGRLDTALISSGETVEL